MKLSLLTNAVLLFACAACGTNQTHPDPHAEYDAGAATPLQCVPNLDGVITATEVKAVLGVPVKYLISPAGKTREVDVVGAVNSTGQLVWNMGTDLADDQTVSLQASALDGKWYASSFPGATFSSPFDAGDSIEAVYSQDDKALYLHGLASTQESPAEGKTLLVYAQPVAVYQFPISVGSTWTATGTVQNATVRGQPYAGQDTYEVTDDATGILTLPDLNFTQAHRIRTHATISPAAGQAVSTWQVSYFFECFGEVARVTSTSNEPNENFTTAAEVRRFGL